MKAAWFVERMEVSERDQKHLERPLLARLSRDDRNVVDDQASRCVRRRSMAWRRYAVVTPERPLVQSGMAGNGTIG